MEHGASPALSWLWGARVQRVDGPWPGCISLMLFARGEKRSLLLAFGASARGVGSVPTRPKGAPASAFVQRLRAAIEGGRLSQAHWLSADGGEADGREAAEARAHALVLTFRRCDVPVSIAVDYGPQAPNLLLLREDGTIAGAADERSRRQRFPNSERPYAPTPGRGIARVESEPQLAAAGEQLLTGSAQRTDDAQRMQAQATARAALKKLERKMEAIRGDLARAHRAPELRREAALLLCHLRAIPRGASEIRLLDESAEPAVWLEIALDPARTPQQLVEQRFERARKLERGLAIGGARLLDAEAAAERLRTFLARLGTPEALEQLTPEADMLGLKLALPSAPASRPKAPQRVPYRLFLSAGSQKILVGKGARDNDLLTLTLARPHDHWLHVRGAPGSHVVVPLDRGATIGQEVLLDAAHLAAHFSQERGEPTVDIAHTERRFVRKAKGAPAGQVKLERERVFALRIEPERLARLLAAERASR